MSIPSRHASREALRPIRASQAPPGRKLCAHVAAQPTTAPRIRDTDPHSRTTPCTGSTATVPRTFAAVLLVIVIAFTLTACGPDRGLKVSPEGNPSPSLFTPDSEGSGPPDEPFSLKQIREAIVDSSGTAVTGRAPETAKVVADCKECVKFSAPFHRKNKKFQVVTVANPQQRDELIAGAVISKHKGVPRLELIATGNQLKLSPGRNGTLVVQEAMFADGDDACCPSGWSVQVFRLHDGRFEPGQRFTRLNGET